jgi:hypothetical protein
MPRFLQAIHMQGGLYAEVLEILNEIEIGKTLKNNATFSRAMHPTSLNSLHLPDLSL